MGPFEQVGPECPPLSILPKVSGGNGREWEGDQAEGMVGGGPSRGSPKVTVEGFGCWGWVVWDVVVFNLIISQCMITVSDDHCV